MPQKLFDSYSKQLLDELLSPLGQVKKGTEVRDEARQIDVWFIPDSPLDENRLQLGLLGRMVDQTCVFEPYSRRPRLDKVRSCLLKLLVVLLDSTRAARRDRQPPPPESELPMLWILSPFASPSLMERLGGKPRSDWPDGVFFAPDAYRLAFVALDRLPVVPETLWLRLLARGETLNRAVAELLALDPSDSQRDRILQLLASWHSKIVTITDPDEEDRELIMSLSPAFTEWERRTRQEGRAKLQSEAVPRLLAKGMGAEEIAEILDMSVEAVREVIARQEQQGR